MFHHIRTSYTVPSILLGSDFSRSKVIEKTISQVGWEIFRPVNEPIDHILYPESLAATLAALRPSAELDDDTLLAFAHALGGESYTEGMFVMTPAENRAVMMPLSAFCSRFRNTNRAKWVQLFRGREKSYIGGGIAIDHALFDALGKWPSVHKYTADHGGMAEVIAWACLPAACIAVGHSLLSKAFYQSPMTWVAI